MLIISGHEDAQDGSQLEEASVSLVHLRMTSGGGAVFCCLLLTTKDTYNHKVQYRVSQHHVTVVYMTVSKESQDY